MTNDSLQWVNFAKLKVKKRFIFQIIAVKPADCGWISLNEEHLPSQFMEMGREPSSVQESEVISTHLHFPGFSQNPFSVLHAALHSQPEPETAAVTTQHKTSKTVNYSAVALYLTEGNQ